MRNLDKVKEQVLLSLDEISPEQVINGSKSLNSFVQDSEFHLLALGKGSAYFAEAVAKKYSNLISGRVLDIEKPADLDTRIEVLVGDHPLSNQRNANNSQRVIKFIVAIPENKKIVVVICGGASALLIDTVNPLDETINIYQELLKANLSINEMNVVRKHLDKLKGGGLAKLFYPRKSLNLYVSDVPGNDLASIGSGPTVFDPTTADDAEKILNNLNINCEVAETPKNKQIFTATDNQLLLSISDLLDVIEKKIAGKTYRDDTFLAQNQDQIVKKLINICHTKYDTFILGGESQLEVKGVGLGGRCTHLALKILANMPGDYGVISFATDGRDNSNAAGVMFLSHEFLQKTDRSEIDQTLNNFDSYNLFNKYNALIKTGPLPVNLSDLLILFR